MKHLAIIPARSGSKGLPDKNINPLCGKPLLAYSVEAAIQSGIFDTVHVSTDAERYAEIAKHYGASVPFLRSEQTSSDTASSWDMVLEVLDKYERLGKHFNTIVLLQPTSPLRMADDIRNAYNLLLSRHAKTVVSVCEMEHSPLWCNTLPEDNCMDGFITSVAYTPRQQLKKYYRLNGAIYITSVEKLRKTGSLVYDSESYAYIMPTERSIDIDTYMDFLLAEAILRSGNILYR